MDALPVVIVYTDGACDPNPGPGGWAALLQSRGQEKSLSGSSSNTTNNRMELQAVIAALEALRQPCQVQLHTDSEYVQRGVTEYLESWKARGWKTSGKRAVANRDLWEALDQAMQRHQIDWFWVKGHAGDPLNERVDQLAVSMIPRSSLPLDDREAFHVFTGVSCRGPPDRAPGRWSSGRPRASKSSADMRAGLRPIVCTCWPLPRASRPCRWRQGPPLYPFRLCRAGRQTLGENLGGSGLAHPRRSSGEAQRSVAGHPGGRRGAYRELALPERRGASGRISPLGRRWPSRMARP